MNYLGKTSLALVLSLPISAEAGDPWLEGQPVRGPEAEYVGLWINPQTGQLYDTWHYCKMDTVKPEFACVGSVDSVHRDPRTGLVESLVLFYEPVQPLPSTAKKPFNKLWEMDRKLATFVQSNIKPALLQSGPDEYIVHKFANVNGNQSEGLTEFGKLVDHRDYLYREFMSYVHTPDQGAGLPVYHGDY